MNKCLGMVLVSSQDLLAFLNFWNYISGPTAVINKAEGFVCVYVCMQELLKRVVSAFIFCESLIAESALVAAQSLLMSMPMSYTCSL